MFSILEVKMVKFIELNFATSRSRVGQVAVVRVTFHFLSTNMDTWLLPTKHQINFYEYTSSGELRREIALKGGVVNPYRAVHMDGDQFLVCQAGWNNLQRVCLIDNGGNLIKSFGSTKGSGNANLSGPYRLVVDRNGFILVADYSNNRVVLLNKQLEYVKDIIPTSMKLNKIFTLFLDEDDGRLYVSDTCNKKLAIVALETRVWYGTVCLKWNWVYLGWCISIRRIM